MKEQINTFLLADIGGTNKVFTLFLYCMTFKEARAYHWALRAIVMHLIFMFLGNSIIEAANIGLKEGGVNVSTNMTIENSGATQLHIGQQQTNKK